MKYLEPKPNLQRFHLHSMGTQSSNCLQWIYKDERNQDSSLLQWPPQLPELWWSVGGSGKSLGEHPLSHWTPHLANNQHALCFWHLLTCSVCLWKLDCTLSWRVQNFVVIDWEYFKPEHLKFWLNFEFNQNSVSGMGTRQPFEIHVHWPDVQEEAVPRRMWACPQILSGTVAGRDGTKSLSLWLAWNWTWPGQAGH